MARIHEPVPQTEPDASPQPVMNVLQAEAVRPAFIVDSAGVATPGNLVRGEGFTMRHGDVWPAYRRRRNLH